MKAVAVAPAVGIKGAAAVADTRVAADPRTVSRTGVEEAARVCGETRGCRRRIRAS